MADQEEQSQPSPPMQESWVDVQEGEGKLVHNRSKEELEKLLASAVSEEEPEMSDSETMYQVSFKPCESPQHSDDTDESPTTSPVTSDPPQQLPTIVPVSAITQQTRAPLVQSAGVGVGTSQSSSPSSSSCGGSLLWCVPVLILTHLAIFGIGYFLGRRPAVEASPLKLLHV